MQQVLENEELDWSCSKPQELGAPPVVRTPMPTYQGWWLVSPPPRRSVPREAPPQSRVAAETSAQRAHLARPIGDTHMSLPRLPAQKRDVEDEAQAGGPDVSAPAEVSEDPEPVDPEPVGVSEIPVPEEAPESGGARVPGPAARPCPSTDRPGSGRQPLLKRAKRL
jgi:hypothetical protein